MIPLLHDFTDQTVLIIGGGSVGARKARRFAHEADVVVVSPRFVDDNGDARGDSSGRASDSTETAYFRGAQRVRAAPEPADAADWVARFDPVLVVVATDNESVNDAFAATARDTGVLVNRADTSAELEANGRVVVPATVIDGPVTVAVATSGVSPALSKHLRECLETEFETTLEGAGAMASLTADLRVDLKARGVAPESRRDALRAVVRSEPVWKALRVGSANPRKTADDVVSRVVGDGECST